MRRLGALSAGLALAASGCAWVQQASISNGGVSGNAGSSRPALSADGRFVAFQSDASNLVAGDTNGHTDVFLRDNAAGTIAKISGGAATQGNGDSYAPAISDDGRYVAFTSAASNLVRDDSNGVTDVFSFDVATATTTRVSVANDGSQANGASREPSISGAGSKVAFTSEASNLVAGDTNAASDVFVRDLAALPAATRLISVATCVAGFGFTQNTWASSQPSMSGDGTTVAYTLGSYFVIGAKVYTKSSTGCGLFAIQPQLVSILPNGTTADYADHPAISTDGRYVSWTKWYTFLCLGTGCQWVTDGVMIRDRTAATTATVPVATPPPAPPLYYGGTNSALSGDGQISVFNGPFETTPSSWFWRAANNAKQDESQTTFRVNQSGATDGTISRDGHYGAYTLGGQVYTRLLDDPPSLYPFPISVPRGSTSTLTIYGGPFKPDASVGVSGTGVTVASLTNYGDTLYVGIHADPGAATGPYNVVVLNPGSWAAAAGAAGYCTCVTVT